MTAANLQQANCAFMERPLVSRHLSYCGFPDVGNKGFWKVAHPTHLTSQSRQPRSPLSWQLFRSRTSCQKHRRLHCVKGAAVSTPVKRKSRRNPGPRTIEEVISKIRESVGVDLPANLEIHASGQGTYLGTPVHWEMTMRPDGSFMQDVKGPHLRQTWGYDGSDGASSCWEVDDSGVSKSLVYDDEESVLLCSWCLSGFWLNPRAQEVLDVRLVPPLKVRKARKNPDAEHCAAEVGIMNAASAVAANAMADRSGGRVGEQYSPDSAASTSGAENDIIVGLKLKRGKVEAQIRVSGNSWQPLQMEVPMCGELETWQYDSWVRWDPRVAYPQKFIHVAVAGGEHVYTTAAVRVQPRGPRFAMPFSPLRPPDALFDPRLPPDIPAVYTLSGHILVEPEIDGRRIGLMILDTGASGFVVEKPVADALGLEAFGELFVSGMAGKVKCQFRRAGRISVGPLTMERPLFMEMALDGLVRGVDRPVIGIIGYDMFRRAVVEIPPPPVFPPGPKGDPLVLRAFDPETYDAQPPGAYAGPITWQPVIVFANLPHIQAEFLIGNGGADGEEEEVQSALFMLDSGAGGVDVMFHSRAVKDLKLRKAGEHKKYRIIKGVGGEGVSGIKVQSGQLAWISLSGSRFEDIQCLFAPSGGLDLSQYTSGIICASLMFRCTVIIDLPRKRLAFLPAAKGAAKSLS